MTLHAKITGSIFVALGLITLLVPSIFKVAYGLDTDDVTTRNLVQSLVAGTEIALGIVLIMSRWFGFDLATLIGAVAVILLTIGIIRLFTAIVYSHFHVVSLFECGIELSAALFLFSVLKADRPERAL